MEELLRKHQKIGFSGDGASHQNVESDHAINMIVTMARIILMQNALRYPEKTFSTDPWKMEIDYAVLVYNWIPSLHSGLSYIEIWSRSMFEPVSETLSNCHVWGCPEYVL